MAQSLIVGLSPRNFRHLFRASTDVGPSEMFENMRLEKGCPRLALWPEAHGHLLGLRLLSATAPGDWVSQKIRTNADRVSSEGSVLTVIERTDSQCTTLGGHVLAGDHDVSGARVRLME
jgi:hypothetical protein